jgi:hypothetical protein
MQMDVKRRNRKRPLKKKGGREGAPVSYPTLPHCIPHPGRAPVGPRAGFKAGLRPAEGRFYVL